MKNMKPKYRDPKPKRIAMIIDYFNPKVHGSHEYHLTKELIKSGFDVTIITSNINTKWGAVTKKDMKKRFRTGNSAYEGIPVVRLPALLEISNVPIVPKLYDFLIKNDFDIIHSHEYFTYSSYLASKAAEHKGVPFIFTNTGYKKSERPVWKYIYLINEALIGKKVLKRAAGIINLTEQSKEFLISIGANKNKMYVTPTGVNTEIFKPGIEKMFNFKGKVILSCSRLIENKGIHILIEAFKIIKKRIPDAVLVIVGKGVMEKELKKRAQDVGDIHFMGTVAYPKMPSVYNSAEIFCLPTLYEEPYGNVIVESAACGIPSVGSYVGGIKETIKDGYSGFHVKPGSVKKLSEKLIILLEDNTLRKRMGKNARKRAVEHYSWKKIALKTSKIYGRVYNKNKGCI